MELDLFALIPNSPTLLGCSAARAGSQYLVTGGIEHFSTHAKANASTSISQQKPSTYFQMRILQIPTATWSPNVVVSNGILNRSYHAAVAVREELFVFGGVQRKPSVQQAIFEPCHDIIHIRKGVFGYKSTLVKFEDHAQQGISQLASNMGLTATVVGQHQDRVVLFGGLNIHNQTYSNQVHLFVVEEGKPGCFKTVEIDPSSAATPPPRAFHTATLISSTNPQNIHQTFLVIFGGETEGKHLLNDMWVLDLTEVLAAEYHVPDTSAPPPEDPKAKGKAPAKGKDVPVAPKGPVATWTKVHDNVPKHTVLSRAKHNAFIAKTDNHYFRQESPESQAILHDTQDIHTFDFVIFGGFAANGPLSIGEYCHTRLTVDNHGTPKVRIGDFHSNASFPTNTVAKTVPPLMKAILLQKEAMYGSSVGYIYDNDFFEQQQLVDADDTVKFQVGLLVFGGSRSSSKHGPGIQHDTPAVIASFDITYMITTILPDPQKADQPASILKRIRRIVLDAHKHIEGMSVPPEDAQSHDGKRKIKTIHYPNGDVYHGEVVRYKKRGDNGEEGEQWYDESRPSAFAGMEIDDSNSVGTLDLENPEGVPGVHIPTGSGRMQYSNGDVYDGEWFEEMKHGNGHYTFHNAAQPKYSAVYEGEYRYDRRVGRGKYTAFQPLVLSADPSSKRKKSNNIHEQEDAMMRLTYDGPFDEQEEFNGPGEMTYEDVSGQLTYYRVFKGSFVGGKKNGEGAVYTIPTTPAEENEAAEESVITGLWKDDRLVGHAEAKGLRIQSMNVSLGHIAGEKHISSQYIDQHHSAVIAKIDGIRADKFWLKGVYEGSVALFNANHDLSLLSPLAFVPNAELGICKYEDHAEYRGGWKNGRRNGQGVYLFPNGDKYEGKWVGDKRCGFGRFFTILPGDSSVSPMKHTMNNTLIEEGLYESHYEGQWEENAYHGDGLLFDREHNSYYLGNFVYGFKEGLGKVHNLETNDALHEGVWAHDHLVPAAHSLGKTTTVRS